MDRFYQPDLHSHSEQVILSPPESQHLVKVLRKKTGSLVHLINGKGGLATGEILTVDSKACLIQVLDFKQQAAFPYALHLAIAPTKSNDRFEWFLEKATEIGVGQITPLLCANSERRKVNIERWKKIILSATKQSQQAFLPQLNALTSFKDFITDNTSMLLAHCKETPKKVLFSLPATAAPCCILIGPEGDFSWEEINAATTQGAQPIKLANNRLRTETAGIVACQTWHLKAAFRPNVL